MDRFEQLLSRLIDGDCDHAERSELAELCSGDTERCERVMDSLSFSELLHQACVLEKGNEVFEDQMAQKLRIGVDDFETKVTRLLCGEEEEEWLEGLRNQPLMSERLRDELEFDDLIAQAASETKSEESFVQALSTRMWAEVEEDHFVDDLTSKIIELDGTQANRIVSISLAETEEPLELNWWQTWSKPVLAAAAALALTGVMLWNVLPGNGVGQLVAESGSVIWDLDYGKTPTNDGELGKGLYRLQSGVVHLQFTDGAEMSVEGPAEFEIKGKREVFVHSGLVVAREAADSNKDFIFAARGLDLKSAGSTVGLDARDGESPELIVLNGGAEVQFSEGEGKRRLYDFEAVRADLERDKLVDIPYNTRPFFKAWELMSGVAANTGTVEVAMPGSQNRRTSDGNHVRVTVERDQFKLADNEQLEVDTLSKGRFVSIAANQTGKHAGEILSEKGQLRSYLLELKPGENTVTESTLEASMTFDHPVVGVIFTEDRLTNSDDLLGAGSEKVNESIAKGQVLLSDDGRTVNLVLTDVDSKSVSGTVRVLVALN